jgi:hypothetical protein
MVRRRQQKGGMCPCMMQAGGATFGMPLQAGGASCGMPPQMGGADAGAIQLSIAPSGGATSSDKVAELEKRLANAEQYIKRITDNQPDLLNPPSQSGGYRATARNKKYLKMWRAGKSIGFTMRSSLKAKGLIPRANGTRRVSRKYR